MPRKKSDRPSRGIHIESSKVRIDGDAVGRDKIERHEHYAEKPYGEWEEFYAGGCLSKLLILIGGIMLIGGVLGFFGSIVYSFINFGRANGFDQMASITPVVGVAFGMAVVGMIILSIGRSIARNRAYRQRRPDQ